jgi:hypothetical protein
MIECSYTGREEQVEWGMKGDEWVVDDDGRRKRRVVDPDFMAFF